MSSETAEERVTRRPIENLIAHTAEIEFKCGVAERLIYLFRLTAADDPHSDCLWSAATAAVSDVSDTLNRHLFTVSR